MNGSDSPQNKRSYDLTGYYYDHKKLGKLDFRRISELFRSSKTANPFLTALRKKRTIPLPITIRVIYIYIYIYSLQTQRC